MERNQAEVKNAKDRRDMVGMLADNGYTVRITTVKKPNTSKRITVVEYYKEEH